MSGKLQDILEVRRQPRGLIPCGGGDRIATEASSGTTARTRCASRRAPSWCTSATA
ncbi:MAG: hypothetical protein ACLSVD_01930 [Eggerthellaceae bacterium]